MAYGALLEGGLGIGAAEPLNAITGSIVNAAPLLLAGLSVALGFKAGLFNIGATGPVRHRRARRRASSARQLADAAAVHRHPARGRRRRRWRARSTASSRACLKAFTGAHEVVTTIMLNYIAALTATALVIGPLPSARLHVRPHRATSATPPCRSSSVATCNLGVLIALAFVPI